MGIAAIQTYLLDFQSELVVEFSPGNLGAIVDWEHSSEDVVALLLRKVRYALADQDLAQILDVVQDRNKQQLEVTVLTEDVHHFHVLDELCLALVMHEHVDVV